MKITFVLPYADLAGGIRVVAIYAKHLQRRGHEVVVVSTPPDKVSLRTRMRFMLRGWGSPPKPRSGMPYFEGSGVEHRLLDRYRPVTDADMPDADVVIATWWATAHGVAALSPSKGAPVIFLQGYEYLPELDNSALDAAWRLPMQKIAVSQWLVDLASERFGDPGAVLVPNSVDFQQFNAEPRGKQPEPTVGLLYSTKSIRGVDVTLAAVRLATERFPALRVVAFGTEALWEGLPLPARATFEPAPPQERIRNIYSSCDAWLFGSRSEGFGLPILEAMACRTPVIATPAGAARDLLAKGGGILVRPEDPRSMADAIESIAAMPDPQWRALSNAAHERAHRYSWEDATTLFERALFGAVHGRPEAAETPRTIGA